MEIFGFNYESLKRHKVTERECLEVLADPFKKEVESAASKNCNPTVIWLGMTMKGRLLEIGVEYMSGMDWVFHANDARSQYKKLYYWKYRHE